MIMDNWYVDWGSDSMNPSTDLKKFKLPITESLSNSSPPTCIWPSFWNAIHTPKIKLNLECEFEMREWWFVLITNTWFGLVGYQFWISTYLIRVTNWTFPAMNTFNQVSLFKSLLRRARINQVMKSKFGKNIKVMIQNPHQCSPLSICSFPTMISP